MEVEQEEVEYTRRQQVSPTKKEADYLFLDARNSRAELLWLRFLQLRQWTLHRFSSRRAFAELLLQLERVDVRVQSGSWSLACLQLALQSLQKDRGSNSC